MLWRISRIPVWEALSTTGLASVSVELFQQPDSPRLMLAICAASAAKLRESKEIGHFRRTGIRGKLSGLPRMAHGAGYQAQSAMIGWQALWKYISCRSVKYAGLFCFFR
ncbi:hypothetical protein CHELA20_53522 [Hyphomicrobiales bacterium]|nr:hypothetical protein CHELA41_21405 [Hyphomicrobiales bacterium]CAH1684418.1 hypothetical protein CHELA20_53522 [Hyphomicrobiales bacterium]